MNDQTTAQHARMAAALHEAATLLPQLVARSETLEADAAYLRRALWLFHGCSSLQRTQDPGGGSWNCLACGVDFGRDSVFAIVDGLHAQDARRCGQPHRPVQEPGRMGSSAWPAA